MPEFLEVVRLLAFGGLNAERRVAARAAGSRQRISALRLLRQREEGPRLGLGLVDEVGRYAVVGDDGETVGFERFADPAREGLEVLVRILEGHGGDLVGGNHVGHG
jgi:hypothetical protein